MRLPDLNFGMKDLQHYIMCYQLLDLNSFYYCCLSYKQKLHRGILKLNIKKPSVIVINDSKNDELEIE